MKLEKLLMYLAYLLRHHPEAAGLHMDRHGWVDVQELIDGVNAAGQYTMPRERLEEIVATDKKGRYCFDEAGRRVKACQGHSLAWVEPELILQVPPEVLYHGTTMQAWRLIRADGVIRKMERHAVHMRAEKAPAWKSAKRWKLNPVILQIDAGQMHPDGFVFGVSENDVWCTEQVPTAYISAVLNEVKVHGK